MPGDPGGALATADAFRVLSHPFIQKIAGRNNASEIALQDIGGMIASATSLTLALELYLKALCLITRRSIQQEHNLWVLYRSLRDDVRRSLEAMYDGAVSTPDGQTIELDVVVSLTPDEPIPPDRRTAPKDRSLPSTLKKSADAFSTWRYLYGAAGPNQPARISFDFHCLGVASDVVRTHAVAILEGAERMRAEGTDSFTITWTKRT